MEATLNILKDSSIKINLLTLTKIDKLNIYGTYLNNGPRSVKIRIQNFE